jgi:hypothetical protein
MMHVHVNVQTGGRVDQRAAEPPLQAKVQRWDEVGLGLSALHHDGHRGTDSAVRLLSGPRCRPCGVRQDFR